MADITSIATTLGREAATKVRDFAATNSQAKKAKDAAYTFIGLGVMGAQKLNIIAKNIQHKVDETIDTEGLSAAVSRSKADVTASVKRTATTVDTKVNEVIAMAEAVVAPLEAKLPEQAREVAAKVRSMGAVARAKVTEAITDEVVVAETPAEAATTEETKA